MSAAAAVSKIKPITGMLNKLGAFHIAFGITGGIISGYGFWYGLRMPLVNKRDAYYVSLAQQKTA